MGKLQGKVFYSIFIPNSFPQSYPIVLMQLPQRFDIDYIGADGEKHRPIMLHRVIFGSIERFIETCYSVKKGETNRKTAVNVIYLTRMIEQINLYF